MPCRKNQNHVHFSGMSSRIGNVLGGRTTYIGGAPRSQENGQVLMFEPALKTEDKTLHITPDHYLTGDQFGACFGYDIALVDFNGDGWVDVCVFKLARFMYNCGEPDLVVQYYCHNIFLPGRCKNFFGTYNNGRPDHSNTKSTFLFAHVSFVQLGPLTL